MTTKQFAAASLVGVALGGVILITSHKTQRLGGDVTATLDNPQQVVWVKPTTDLEWAKDTSKENFDLKSTGVLNRMLGEQNVQLQNANDSFDIYLKCAECIKYQLQKDNPKWSVADVDTQFTNEFNDYQWRVEKITQSIERIEHELDLRARGIVVPDKLDTGATTDKVDLQKVAPEMVRHISD